jgi:hypothetical protein
MAMFGSVVLEVAIGLAYLYLLLSVICSAINEGLAGMLALRAKTLGAALRNLLDDSTVDALYAHPLIQGLSGACRAPSYIPARVFATALLDVLDTAKVATTPATIETVRSRIAALPDGKVKRALLPLVNQASGDLPQARRNLESWFNDAMDRVSGWYKRRAQVIIVGVALVISIVLNADALMIANRLAENSALVARVTAVAQNASQQPAQAGAQSPTQAESALKALQLPLGWSTADPRTVPLDAWGWLAKMIGLLFTATAVSLGAPFWFDVLGRLVNLRASGAPPPPPDEGTAGGPSPQPVHIVVGLGANGGHAISSPLSQPGQVTHAIPGGNSGLAADNALRT